MAEVAVLAVYVYECVTCAYVTSDREAARSHANDGLNIHDGRWLLEESTHICEIRPTTEVKTR